MFKKLFSLFSGSKETENKQEAANASKQEAVQESANERKLYATQNGQAVDITEVPDPVFGGKMLGEGFAIIPTDGKVYSPVSGEVASVTNSLHAYGIRTNDGVEVLVHIGLETVSLNGEGFKSSIKQGDHVKAGDLLAEVDLAFIEEKGCKTITPVVFTNLEEGHQVKFNLGQVTARESVVAEY